ncbi:MFS transporter [Salinisphaera aquimarina]|uniref:MFS transporter n=1 Tax=Salinisphaera aquimarina TaxID=2094031 RepID=A0ABV7ESF7_9GAMM
MTTKPIGGLWRNRVYRHLFAAQISALIGTGLTTIALALLAYDLAGGNAGRVLGIALACKMVAYVGIAPVVGGYAQRLPRKVLLVTLDLLRAGFVLCLPWVTAVWQIYVLIFLLNGCSAGFTPVFQATIPEVVPDDAQYTRALALSRLAYELENLLSPALATALLFLVSYNQLFMLNGLAFLGSAALVVTTALPAVADETGSINVWQRVSAGVRRYLGNHRLRAVLALYAGVAAAGAMIIVNTVVYVRQTLGGGDVQVAQAFMASGAGSMLAALWLPRWLDRHSERSAMLAGGLLLGLALLIGGLWLPGFAGLLAVWFVLGIGLGLIQTPVGRLLTAASDSSSRPGVFSAQFALSHACWLVGYPLAGVLGSAVGPRPTLLVLGVIALIAWAVAGRLWPFD